MLSKIKKIDVNLKNFATEEPGSLQFIGHTLEWNGIWRNSLEYSVSVSWSQIFKTFCRRRRSQELQKRQNTVHDRRSKFLKIKKKHNSPHHPILSSLKQRPITAPHTLPIHRHIIDKYIIFTHIWCIFVVYKSYFLSKIFIVTINTCLESRFRKRR